MATTIPPGMDLTEDQGATLQRVIIPFIPLSTVAIILRLWSRLVSREKLWWDDLCTLGAWACGIIIISLGVVCADHGVGMHTIAVLKTRPHDFEYSQKRVYAAFILFAIGITFVKLAALTFYTRIFRIVATFRIALYICYALTIMWLISNIPIAVAYCLPIQKFWKPQLEGKCINLFLWHITEGVFDVFLNVCILALPMPVVWQLHASTSRKILLMVAFFFGYLALIPSIGRLVYTAALGKDISDDFYFDVVDIEWSLLEPSICVISLCIPSWFQLAKRARNHGFKALFTGRDPTTKARLRGPMTKDDRLFNARLGYGRSRSSSFHRLQGESIFEAMGLGTKFVVDSGIARELHSGEDIELNEDSIQVHQEISVENGPGPKFN